jgi:DNA-binding response OmpR family regulator
MPGNRVTHAEVERILNDREKIILLHTLEGEIWGASTAATDLFGYSNEEMRQMCLVNIRPKALRLSDVCKDKMGDDAVVVFQKRNNRRFTASVQRSVISFIHQREPIELVCLELILGDAGTSSKPKAPHIDIHELTQFVVALKDECQVAIRDLSRDIKALAATDLTSEQQRLVDRVHHARAAFTQISDNIVDSFQLAQNSLSLESEPFNIVEFLSRDVPRLHPSVSVQQHLILSPDVPELIYGDKKVVEKVFRNILNQVANFFSPEGSLLTADYQLNGESAGHLFIRFVFDRCKSLTLDRHRDEYCAEFLNSMPMVFSRHLLRLMDGILKFSYQGEDKIELNFDFLLPEVHDLGLSRKLGFLKGKQVILVDAAYSPLAIQLRTWGAQLEHFLSVDKAVGYIQPISRATTLFIINGDVADMGAIVQCDVKSFRLILIGVNTIPDGLKDIAVALPVEATVPTIGNVLSQVVLEDFPYPYYNINSKRNHDVCELGQLLVVSQDPVLRASLCNLLRELDMSVDEAVNGIDAVMASTNCRYDAIIIDDDLPFMDGVEAAIHLRRVSHANKTTPILIVTDDDSENGKLTRAQAGISADILKPLDVLHFEQMIRSLLMQDRNACDVADLDHIGLPVAGLRRQEERQETHSVASNSASIDEQVLDRLAQDTSIEVCKEMVDMFIGESLISLAEISKCCVAGDWTAILAHAHSLRSSCRTFGCETLYSITQQLEEESRKNNLGECIRLASVLPIVFLQSQQSLYDYCSNYNRRN